MTEVSLEDSMEDSEVVVDAVVEAGEVEEVRITSVEVQIWDLEAAEVPGVVVVDLEVKVWIERDFQRQDSDH